MKASFFGLLARGASYDMSGEPAGGEAMQTELVVGVLQGAASGDINPAAFVARLVRYMGDTGQSVPPWLTPELIAHALSKLSALQGQWRATPFGETMVLRVPL